MAEIVRVGIVGASGYGGVQLVRLLLDHPLARLTFLGANQSVGAHYGELYPQLAHRIDMVCEAVDPIEISGRCDVVFSRHPMASPTPWHRL